MNPSEQVLATALEHQRAGRLEAAAQIYRQILAREAAHPDAQHLLGLIVFQWGDADEALRLLHGAIRADARVPVYHSNLGTLLQALGHSQEAEGSFREALRLNPNYLEVHLYLGNLALARGCWEEAADWYRRALGLKPDYAQAHNNLGNVYARQGRLEEAVACFREALRLDPDLPEGHLNLGNALRDQGHLTGAEDCLRRALALKPNLAEAQLNLAAVFEDQGRLEEAADGLQRLLRMKPDYVQALSNLGSVLKKLGRLTEARRCLEKALELKPDFSEAHNNLGAVLEQMGCWEGAASRYQTALRWQPDLVEAHMNLSMLWLLTGEFERGWKEHEWRWKKKGTAPRACGRPLWDGAPLEGRTILLQAEQGLGDTLQFIRYAAVVKQHGGRVVFECPARLAPLLRTVPGVDRLIDPGDPPPQCDVYAPLLSLPRILRTTLASIPCQVPYLAVDGGLVEAWRTRIGECAGRRKIGLVWGGNPSNKNDRNRSVPLRQFAPLAIAPRLALFSLQRGPQAAELRSAPPGLEIADLEESAGQVTDTAAAILCLDLVITVDTMAAHLAGALGRPVWLLLPFAPDYRWLLGREDSPWYPTMRLFRQPSPGDWLAVIRRVVEELHREQAF